MSDFFRIHGDNIIECERIANLIVQETQPHSLNIYLLSPSTIAYDLVFRYCGRNFSWHIELLPGFNKSGRRRWTDNIFTSLMDNGSFLDETPDAIVTQVIGNQETILFAIEFCSALQAGNQAWQRSGRAFSTGRTGCPYLYIVDFVKYELDSRTRKRKALRFPNPAVPYSYINFSKETGNFVAQVYVLSEEFDKHRDASLRNFNENNFADGELSSYIVKRMANFDTAFEEEEILRKNLNVVMFLAQNSRPATNFTVAQWRHLYTCQQGIIQFSIENSAFNFHKTITAKGHHGKSEQMLDLIDVCSVGLASRDLPFGIIPADRRHRFAEGLRLLYPSFDTNVLSKIASGRNDLILCLIKGFKPRGDDNRPDRGILPLAVMLSDMNVEIMTYIYGPVLANSLNSLIKNPKKLAASNGLWKSILALSNYVALDVPVLRGKHSDAEVLLDSTDLKEYYTAIDNNPQGLTQPVFPSIPQEYHEDDVDTGIHFIFAHLLHKNCFEGMCNPPGGDWSGLSILDGNQEARWLSLPRVSREVDGKRPDHVLELFGVFEKPLLLSIESKERSIDLESGVGHGLINYIQSLMSYVPNVKRDYRYNNAPWNQAADHVDFGDFEVISAAAYLRSTAQSNNIVFKNSGCDMLFIMEPKCRGWAVELVPNTRQAAYLKAYIKRLVNDSGYSDIVIF
jgi:hypothetical protein